MASADTRPRSGSPFLPRFVGEFDLEQEESEFTLPPGYRRALVLVRHGGVPLGLVPVAIGDSSAQSALQETIASHLTVDQTLIDRSRHQQSAADEAGPSISVVVCTKDRDVQLRQCLEALCRQPYRRFDIVVVDNTAGSPVVREIVDRLIAPVPVRLVVEPEGGLARARNRGASVSDGSVVAFIDDDATPDRYWLTELAAGYTAVPRAAAVNGAILSSEIETEAQEWFFQYGGHSKGRGFREQVVDPARSDSQSALYPLPPFGAGGNMSVRRKALIQVGGFDEALGAGTPAGGAEETALFTQLLLAGCTIVYRPTALVWHADRREQSDLVRQMRSLGTSLTAYYTSLLVGDPKLIVRLIALLPQGLRDLRGAPGSTRMATMSDSFPEQLLHSNRRGMMSGPWAYLSGRWRGRGRPKAIGEIAA